MSELILKIQEVGSYKPTDEDRVDWIDRITARCLPKLALWDKDFIADVNGKTSFTPRQRKEIERIWQQWKGCC